MTRLGRRGLGYLVGLAIVVMLAGCGRPSTPSGSPVSPVSEAEARAMSEAMLAAYNAGDYSAFSRDWSQAMRDGVPEGAFKAFRDATYPASGAFVRIQSITSRPGQTAGVTRWESACTFEKGTWIFMIAFKDGSKLIEGNTLTQAP